jgi:sugar-specific transcriptional regulator TrmB
LAMQEEDAQILIQLGLTVSQAKVYLTLLKLGQATGKAIAQSSKVARQEVYRILSDLHEEGLVEKIIASPTGFKPVPIEQCLHMLLKQKKRDISDAEKKAIKLIQHFSVKSPKALLEKESFFIMVSEKEAYLRKFRNSIENAKTSFDMLLHWKCFRYGMIEDTQLWRKAVERGVKVRFVVYEFEDEKNVSDITQILMSKGSFEIRYLFTPPPATISIIDNKETSITVSTTPSPHDTPSLWSNNLGLITIFQDYFELTWRAPKIKEHKNQISSPNII